jgi:hypothetical protein
VAIETELARVPPEQSPADCAHAFLHAVGTAYLRFAQRETGLYRAAWAIPDATQGRADPAIAGAIRSSCSVQRWTGWSWQAGWRQTAGRRPVPGLGDCAGASDAAERRAAAELFPPAEEGDQPATARYGGERFMNYRQRALLDGFMASQRYAVWLRRKMVRHKRQRWEALWTKIG